ncbi:MarR family winged helix-turn-helix transcriptional regulator [Deinococcus xinjiangensis]
MSHAPAYGWQRDDQTHLVFIGAVLGLLWATSAPLTFCADKTWPARPFLSLYAVNCPHLTGRLTMSNRFNGTTEEKQALDAYIKLWRASYAVESRANRHLGDHGLTISQFAVLEALYHLGPLSQRQISQKILRSSGNLTLVIDNLERDGLVGRQRAPHDRRVTIVSLTEQGAALIAQILPQHVRGIQDLFAVLEPEELAQFAALSRKLGLALRDEPRS